MPLVSLQGVKIDLYPMSWPMNTREDEIERMGGQAVLDNIIDGDKWWSGLPNLYNRMDIYIRCDINPGYQFSLLEAAACGVSIITTDPGLGKELSDVGGAVYIECQAGNWEPGVLAELAGKIREAVIDLRDHPKRRAQMGTKGRYFVLEKYRWEKLIPSWREFFRKGLENAKKM